MTIGLCLFSITLATKISASYNCFRALILNILKYDPNNYPNGINLIILRYHYKHVGENGIVKME